MPFTYYCRPGYGSEDLLIEFHSGTGTPDFYIALFEALSPLELLMTSIKNLWMNDESIREMESLEGPFSIHHDIYDLIFILADDNQPVIHAIDAILEVHPLFEKVEVDFARYKTTKGPE